MTKILTDGLKEIQIFIIMSADTGEPACKRQKRVCIGCPERLHTPDKLLPEVCLFSVRKHALAGFNHGPFCQVMLCPVIQGRVCHPDKLEQTQIREIHKIPHSRIQKNQGINGLMDFTWRRKCGTICISYRGEIPYHSRVWRLIINLLIQLLSSLAKFIA
ncbi:Uncharacterised protein [Enterobacter hormaechei]|nr:Uncharacterised protein [Enterobacter hormaechei]